MQRVLQALLLVRLLVPVAVLAQVQNGDFESGGAGWTSQVTNYANVAFPSTGGNPNGCALVTNDLGITGEHGCILQTFECGQAGLNTSCTVRFDYQVQGFDVVGSHSEVTATVDGDVVFDQQFPPSTPGWSSVTVTVPCGTHVLGLCLDVLPGAIGDPYWRASFDNVSGTCDTNIGIEPRPWGAVKRLFEG
jgi:hypothetical protein